MSQTDPANETTPHTEDAPRRVRIEIDLGNAAFTGEDGPHEEIARILKDIAARITWHRPTASTFRLHDVNGNSCGFFDIGAGG